MPESTQSNNDMRRAHAAEREKEVAAIARALFRAKVREDFTLDEFYGLARRLYKAGIRSHRAYKEKVRGRERPRFGEPL